MIKKVIIFMCCTSLIIKSANLPPVSTKVVIDLVNKFIPDNPVIVEAGARFGTDTEKMAQFWTKGQVHAFEPLSNSYKKLEAKALKRKNIFCYKYALSTHNGIADFYVAIGNVGASSLLKPNPILSQYNIHFSPQKIQVKCITLDEWAKQNHIERVDFMWLDMEGHELDMLKKSSSNIFKTVTAVYIEVNRKCFREGTPLYEEVRDWFLSQGFYEEWVRLSPDVQGDVLFVRKVS